MKEDIEVCERLLSNLLLDLDIDFPNFKILL